MRDMIQQSLDTKNVDHFSGDTLREQIARDIKGLQLHFRRTPKRRHVPSTCVPAEVFWCLFFQITEFVRSQLELVFNAKQSVQPYGIEKFNTCSHAFITNSGCPLRGHMQK